MGNIIQAVCPCGLESEEILQGIGFGYFTNGIRTEPAYCDTCGIVIGRDICKSISKCPTCRRKVKFYVEDAKESKAEDQPCLATDDYLQHKEHWHCPRCKKETLAFESFGLWD